MHGGMMRGGKGVVPGPHGVMPPLPHNAPLHHSRDDSSIVNQFAAMSLANHVVSNQSAQTNENNIHV